MNKRAVFLMALSLALVPVVAFVLIHQPGVTSQNLSATIIDFGTVVQGATVVKRVPVRNTTDVVLIIENISST